MAETITAPGAGPLAVVVDGGTNDPGLIGLDYRQFFSVDVDPGTGKVRKHFIFSTGSLRQADFTTSGIYTDAPVGSVLFHVGTRNAALTAGGIIAQRVVTTTADITDWYSGDGVRLDTLVTD